MKRRVIALDAGGTKLLWGVVDEDLEVHHRVVAQWPEPRTREGVLKLMLDAVNDAREAAPDVEAIGAGIPSTGDQKTGLGGYCRGITWPTAKRVFGDRILSYCSRDGCALFSRRQLRRVATECSRLLAFGFSPLGQAPRQGFGDFAPLLSVIISPWPCPAR